MLYIVIYYLFPNTRAKTRNHGPHNAWADKPQPQNARTAPAPRKPRAGRGREERQKHAPAPHRGHLRRTSTPLHPVGTGSERVQWPEVEGARKGLGLRQGEETLPRAEPTQPQHAPSPPLKKTPAQVPRPRGEARGTTHAEQDM